jgi:DNA polymerase-3 subunit alpha
MQYIPNFIDRKHGREEIVYEFPIMEKYLSETYGITVYQEQVMQLSQALAGFTPGEADKLRKAMGKKQIKVMEELREKFISGCAANNYDQTKVEKIWEDWKKFAEYAFNKSHSTCYAYVAFQTAYLKAHYPAEYMSSVLTHNLSDQKKITIYTEECKKLGINVLGPNVNESDMNFMVNKNKEILFGLAGIKNVGAAAAEEIIRERDANGPYISPFDFIRRINPRTINRKCIESLIKSGAFDCFSDTHRAQYFHITKGKDESEFLDQLIKYGAKYKENQMASQISLFDSNDGTSILEDPSIPDCEPWSQMEKLKFEKEMLGFWFSGHPLDMYRMAIDNFVNTEINSLTELQQYEDKEICLAGVVSNAKIGVNKNGNNYARFSIEDESGSYEFFLRGKSYVEYADFCKDNLYLMIKAVVKKAWKDTDRLEVAINKIELLEDITPKYIDGLSINIDIANLNENFLKDFTDICKHSKGKATLSIRITDMLNSEVVLSLKSRKYKIDVEKFIEGMKKKQLLDNISYEFYKKPF